ncbi:ninjurin-2 [Rhipicephalus microplus]|uniref:ninjurin-2 n=1 Tax=Rhipicephalus microplus TaxID=6941 RepID=UPI003F6B4C04
MDHQPVLSSASESVDSPYAAEVTDGNDEMPPVDVNTYATRKTLAQGCLVVALFAVNAAQLKHTLERGTTQHPFYTLVISLASVSIALQVVVAVLLILLGCLDLSKPRHRGPAVVLNNVTTAFVVSVTIVNVLCAAFDLSHSDYESRIPTALPATESYLELTTQGP